MDDLVLVNCARIRNPDLKTIDYLCRVQLGLKRSGRQACLANSNDDLKALIRFSGLSGVLRIEVQRQPEEREEPGGVEEERDLGDPPA